ncbi:MAG: hypothetical protein JNK64_04875 [Myxococcales bacterium]|nr:hypothetical protein [Myxococcales bacterium]
MSASCDACGGKTAAPVCPHCGHRRAPAGAGLGGVGLSKEEARALLTMHAPNTASEAKPIAAYVLPHPRTTGVGHTAEAALTVATAPLWALGLFGFALARMRYRAGTQVPMGELRATFTIAGIGAPLLWFPAMWGLGSAVATAVVVGQVAAWLARGVVRARADERVSAQLSALDRPAPAAALPPAVAQPRPAAPAATLAPAPGEAPAQVEAAPLESGPRLLR